MLRPEIVPLALFIAFHALRQTDRISLTVPGAGLPVLLQDLSLRSGLKLEASPVLVNEVLCLCVKDVPVDDLLGRVALVVGGEWQTNGPGRKLVPSKKVEKQEREERLADRRRRFQAALTKFHEEFRKHPVYGEREAKQALQESVAFQKQVEQWEKGLESGKGGDLPSRAETASDPSARLLFRLFESVPSDDWIDLPSQARIVYSDLPTPMQRRLSLGAQSAIQRYATEQRAFDRFVLPAVNEQIAKSGDEDSAPLGMALPNQFKVNLVVGTGDSEVEAITVKLSVLGAKGKEVQNAEFSLDEPDSSKPTDAAPAPKKPDAGEPPLPKDETAEAFRRLISRARTNMFAPDRGELLKRFLPQISHPEQNEPLATLPGPTYVALADRLGVNLVSNLEDFDLEDFGLPQRKLLTPSEFLARLDEQKRLTREPGWILIKGSPLAELRLYRVDRRAAGSLIRNTIAASGLTIESAADYVAQAGSDSAFALWDSAFLSAVLPAGGRVSTVAVSGDELKLYGLLPPEARHALREHPIPISALPEAARGWLATLVYWRGWLGNRQGNGLEPTEALPSGLPPDGIFRMESESFETIAVPLGPGPSGLVPNGAPMTAMGFGRILAGEAGIATQKSRASQLRSTANFRIAKGRTLKFRIDFAPGLSHEFQLTETLFPESGAVAFQDLPATFRDGVEKARIEAAKQIREQVASPQTTPPPQR